MPRNTTPKAAKNGAARRREVSHGTAATLALILLLALAVAAPALCILFVAGLLPTMAAAIADEDRERYLTRAVGAMNLAGLAPAVLRLWETGISFPGLYGVIGNLYSWLMICGAAAFGWLLYLALPSLGRGLVELRAEELKRRLEAQAEKLVEEWGPEVTGRKGEGA